VKELDYLAVEHLKSVAKSLGIKDQAAIEKLLKLVVRFDQYEMTLKDIADGMECNASKCDCHLYAGEILKNARR
jgi:hypothetical protein